MGFGAGSGDIPAEETDRTRGRFGVAGHAIEKRALAGPVGTDQTDDFAFCDVEVRAVHRPEGAELLDDAARLKEHAAPSGW
jgi:hypothetical protein